MDDPRWLRLIVVGLILAALVVGYSLLTGGFVKSKPSTKKTEVARQTPIPTTVPTPTQFQTPSPVVSPGPSIIPQPLPSPSPVNNRISEKGQVGIQTLPRTGFPLGLAVTFAISTMIAGWSIRKFPH